MSGFVRRRSLGIWLPGTLVVVCNGSTFPVLSAAAVLSLHPERVAVGSAVNQTARQVGGALGVAVLVVILGTPTGAYGMPSTSITGGGSPPPWPPRQAWSVVSSVRWDRYRSRQDGPTNAAGADIEAPMTVLEESV